MKQCFNKYFTLPRNSSRFDLSSSLVTTALEDSEIERDGFSVSGFKAAIPKS